MPKINIEGYNNELDRRVIFRTHTLTSLAAEVWCLWWMKALGQDLEEMPINKWQKSNVNDTSRSLK